MIEEPVTLAIDQSQRPLRRLAQQLRHPFGEGGAGVRLREIADKGLAALGRGVEEAARVVEAGAGSGDLGDLRQDRESLLGNETWIGWIEAARAILEGEQ